MPQGTSQRRGGVASNDDNIRRNFLQCRVHFPKQARHKFVQGAPLPALFEVAMNSYIEEIQEGCQEIIVLPGNNVPSVVRPRPIGELAEDRRKFYDLGAGPKDCDNAISFRTIPFCHNEGFYYKISY
jgi:hypothetical protein